MELLSNTSFPYLQDFFSIFPHFSDFFAYLKSSIQFLHVKKITEMGKSVKKSCGYRIEVLNNYSIWWQI